MCANGGDASWLTRNAKRHVCGTTKMSKRVSALSLESTKSDDVGIEAFLDLQREISKRTANGGVAESKGDVEMAGPRRGSKGTRKRMRAVKSINGESGERKPKRVDCGEKMEARECKVDYETECWL